MFLVVQELHEELEQLGYGRQDFDWAVAVLHSRCCVYGRSSTHMVVPGVDMANHSFTPNAAVRCTSTPAWKVDRVVGSKGVWTEEAGCHGAVCTV